MSTSPTFQSPVGTHDVLAPASALWEGTIATFADLAYRYGFSLVMTPLFEDVGVFHRGIGAESEVATKEMYTFEDRGGRTFALRPEGTASVVRAFVQHNPPVPFKAWYFTPAFRYERPQAGRYRQHHQVGVEALGTDDPALDVEVISLAWHFYQALGLRHVRLLLNSMGHGECRGEFTLALLSYLESHAGDLCDEHRVQFRVNALRVVDCKKPGCSEVTSQGPMLPDFLCDDCTAHFTSVRTGLEQIGIPYELTPRLVRGFDYYTRTTFEFVADALGTAQNAIGGGGRYDKLAEQLGGKPTSGIGFGSGVERLLLARSAENITTDLLHRVLDVFVVDSTEVDVASGLVHELRQAGFAVDRAYDGRSMKSQMKAADRSGARVAVLVGPNESATGEVSLRDLRSSEGDESQRRLPKSELIGELRKMLGPR